MKKFKKSLLLSMILIVFMSFVITKLPCFSANAEQTSNIVMEQSSKRILDGFNIDSKMPMASTTKILTAITVISLCDLSEEVKIDSRSVGIEGSSIYLKEGDVYTVEELLYGLMLRSGNDAAVALALHAGKTMEKFLQYMNSYAKKIGAVNSNFTNPHGLHDANHYTTARDLALITCHALDNQAFSKIVETKRVTFNNRTYVNKNKMLKFYEGADGVKTGYTVKAGRCLVSSATRNGMRLVCVVLNCQDMYEKSQTLLDKCFNDYKMHQITKNSYYLGKLPLKTKFDKSCEIYLDKPLSLPLKSNETNYTITFSPIKLVSIQTLTPQYIGKLSIMVDKDLIFSAKLFTIITDEKRCFASLFYENFARGR